MPPTIQIIFENSGYSIFYWGNKHTYQFWYDGINYQVNTCFWPEKIASKPWVVKVSPKLDMVIVWINIWDLQSSLVANSLINCCFNISSFIATIHGTNINSGILQCKNCWKWSHTTFACHFQGSWYVKYNGPHKVKHHWHFTWCCKANFKINPPCLETKQGELCPYTFKCINCKGDYQADSNICPFWYYCFNKEWHMRKYQELRDVRNWSIHSAVNSNNQWFSRI